MDGYDDDKVFGAVIESMGEAAKKAKAAKLMPKKLTNVMPEDIAERAASSRADRIGRKMDEYEEETGYNMPNRLQDKLMSDGSPDAGHTDAAEDKGMLAKLLEQLLGQ